MFQALQCLVLLLDAIDEIAETGLEHFFDILLLYHFAGEWLVVVFILVGFVCGCETATTEAFVHFDDVVAYFFVFLLHFNNIQRKFQKLFKGIIIIVRSAHAVTKFEKFLVISNKWYKITFKKFFIS